MLPFEQYERPVRGVCSILVLLILAALGGRLVDAALLVFLVLTHEAAHLAVAAGFGCRIQSLHLMPLGGSLSLGPELEAVPAVEATVALAGPLHHLMLMALGGLIPSFARILGSHWPFFFRANLSLAFFNLLPLYPLDGGHILIAVLNKCCGAVRAAKITRRLAKILALLLVVAGALLWIWGQGPWLAFSGIYLTWLGPRQQRQLFLGLLHLSEGKRDELARRPLALHCLAVGGEAEVLPTLYRAAARRYLIFCVLDTTGKPLTWISEEQAINALTEYGPTVKFSALAGLPGRIRR